MQKLIIGLSFVIALLVFTSLAVGLGIFGAYGDKVYTWSYLSAIALSLVFVILSLRKSLGLAASGLSMSQVGCVFVLSIGPLGLPNKVNTMLIGLALIMLTLGTMRMHRARQL